MPHERAILQVASDKTLNPRWAVKDVCWVDSFRVGAKVGNSPHILTIAKVEEPTVIVPQRVINCEPVTEDELKSLIREDGWREFHPPSG